MKLSISAVGGVLMLAMLASGCSSDPIPSTPDRNERYDREFVREFGVPDPNHTWSDAGETTLTFVSGSSTHVRVYYQEDDALYLVGDVTAPQGEQLVPFMVPTSISSLIVETENGRTSAPVGARVDLDAITNASRAESRYYVTEVPLEERQILFTFDNVTKKYFDAFPIGQNNLYTENQDVDFYNFICCRDSEDNPKDFMLYPIYWKNDYRQFSSVEDFFPKHATKEDYEGRFPLKIDFSFNIDDYESDRVPTQISPGPTGNGSYPPSGDLTIRSYGIRYSNFHSIVPSQNFGSIEVSMNGRLAQSYNLYDKFWDVTGRYLNRAYDTMIMYHPKNTTVTYKVPVKTDDNNLRWEERKSEAFFIGVSQPPMENRTSTLILGDTHRPDFCDIVYLAVPADMGDKMETTFSSAGSSTSSQYTFAAEDLGGSYDWDFNDVVFTATCVTCDASQTMIDLYNFSSYDVYLHTYESDPEFKNTYVYRISVTPNAAGGTMPVYIAYKGSVTTLFEQTLRTILGSDSTKLTYNDFAIWIERVRASSSPIFNDGISIIGTEVHKWLGGTSTAKPLNVDGSITHTGRTVTFYSKTGIDHHYGAIMSNADEALKNFFIIVDKENTLGIDTSEAFDPNGEGEARNAITPFDGVFGEGAYTIGAVSEDRNSIVPQMICVNSKTWQWPMEERHISLGYPKFRDWVSDQYTLWMYNTNNEHLNDRR